MFKLFAKLNPSKVLLVVLGMLFAAGATAASNWESAKLMNQSKGNDAYILIHDKIWSENDCVKIRGNKKIKPGQAAEFDVKKGCTWAAIGFNIEKANGKEDAGYLVYSFRDGKTKLEVSSQCQGKQCVFYDLNPQQQGRK